MGFSSFAPLIVSLGQGIHVVYYSSFFLSDKITECETDMVFSDKPMTEM